MTGDGLTDIVRIRNGEVCYWPNLGYGRFGAKVTMDNAPRFDDPDQFDQRRIRLADIDGCGTTDMIYLGARRRPLWFNQSGNAWSAPHRHRGVPARDDRMSSVQVARPARQRHRLPGLVLAAARRCPPPDALRRPDGRTASRTCWSGSSTTSAPKPASSTPPRPGSTSPTSAPATRGSPGCRSRCTWSSASRPIDWIGRNRFVTRYTYHHGYFDGFEREFRGFGMVEQWDTEEFRTDTAFDSVTRSNWDRSPGRRRC